MIFRQAYASNDPYLLWPVTPERTTILNRGTNVNLVGSTAYVQVSPHSVVGAGTKTIVMAGQSNIGNFVGTGGDTAYSISNSGIYTLSTGNGGLYQAQDNLLGANGTVGSIGARLADKLRTAGWATKIVLASMAIGGTSISSWAQNTGFGNDMPVMFKRLAAIGLTADIIIMAIGESDAAGGTSQVTFETLGASCCAGWRAAGFTCPILWTLSTYIAPSSSATIRAAITAVASDNDDCFLGADTDTVTTRADGIHFSQASALDAAELHKDEVLLY